MSVFGARVLYSDKRIKTIIILLEYLLITFLFYQSIDGGIKDEKCARLKYERIIQYFILLKTKTPSLAV